MTLSDNVRASLYMLLAMAGFTINDGIIKSLGGAMGVYQIIGIRGLVLCVFIGMVIWHRGLVPRLGEVRSWLILLRALLDLAATVLFILALMRLPFANVSAIMQSLPLVVTLGAAMLFREPVGWRRWSAIIIGLGGVLVILRPGGDSFDATSLLVVLSVLGAAGRDLCTRRMPPALPSLLVAGTTAVLITLVGLVMTTVTGQWVPVSADQFVRLSVAAVFLFVGYQFIILAVRTGEVAAVVPYRYTSLLWATAIGFLFYGELPDRFTLIGSAIVVATGLYTLYRELRAGQRLARQAREPALPATRSASVVDAPPLHPRTPDTAGDPP